jgi:hypothetical protein
LRNHHHRRRFQQLASSANRAAAKQADQLGDRSLSRRILQLKEATPNDACLSPIGWKGRRQSGGSTSYFTGRFAVASRQCLSVVSWALRRPMPTRKSATKGYCLRSFLAASVSCLGCGRHTQGADTNTAERSETVTTCYHQPGLRLQARRDTCRHGLGAFGIRCRHEVLQRLLPPIGFLAPCGYVQSVPRA